MIRPSLKKWREDNREYYLSYKRAWARANRKSRLDAEFPKARQNKTGKCKSCEAVCKDMYCSYCLSHYPHLSL